VTRNVTRDTPRFQSSPRGSGCLETRQVRREASGGNTSTPRCSWRFSVLLISGRECFRRLSWFNLLMGFPQVGEFHGMFPGVLQGRRGPRARCIQHAFEAHGIIAGGTFVHSYGFLAHASFQESTDKFFDEVNLKQSIDDLHAAVVDAKLRKQRGEVRTDVWREDLHPRAATRARTVPLLERERERLLAELQEVFPLISLVRSCLRPASAGG